MTSFGVDVGELNISERKFINIMSELETKVNQMEYFLKKCCENDVYEKLSSEERIKYDLFISYSLSSLFWLYLRTRGEDPGQHNIKSEIDRIRGYMLKSKQVHDRKLAPKLDQGAANRFVRSSLWEPKQKTDKGSI